MGAVTVARAIAAHPDRFRAAVLEDPAWRSGPLDAGMAESGRAAFDAMLSGTEAEIEAMGRQFSPGWDDAEYGPWARSKTRFRGADHMADALQQMLATRWQDTVARFAVPVLLVCGGDEAKGRIVTAETALEAAATCPSLEVSLLPEAGHNIRREAYDGYVAAVRAFLDRAGG